MDGSQGNGVPQKRRRIADEEDDMSGDNTLPVPEGSATASQKEKETKLQKLAAARRRKRLQEEARELLEQNRAYYPGDDAYPNPTDADTTAAPSEDEDQDDLGNEDDEIVDYEEYLMREEEAGDGEDLMENAMKDYQRIDALDTYGTEGIDDRDYDDMGFDERMAAEQELAQREEQDRKSGRSGRASRFYGALEEMVEEGTEERLARRRQFRRSHPEADGEDDDENVSTDDEEEVDEEEVFETEEEVNLEAFDVPLREWIAQDRTRREVQRKFRNFLMSFRENDDIDHHFEDETGGNEGNSGENDQDGDQTRRRRRQKKPSPPLYEQRIKQMCSSNFSTLEISYLHLMHKEPTLAIWIADAPRDMLDVLNEAATRHTLRLFPSYSGIVANAEINVRIVDVPIMDTLRDLRRSHLDCLIRVNGVVTRRSSVYPQLKLAYYDCVKCRYILGPYRVEESASVSAPGGGDSNGASGENESTHVPGSCQNCQSEGPFRLNSTKTQYRNYQRVNLQETPGSIPPGRVPRTKEVILTNDLIDAARPGDEIEITGIYSHSFDYRLTQRNGFPVFSTFIFANHVRRREDASAAANLTEADKAQIMDLARDPKIGERIVESIAPSIFGHKHVKMALAMSLFGAVPKNINDKHRIRGDINVLLLGDPGTAKSQLLKYAEATAPRAVYSTGKGASAVGLTASVHKDPITKEWTLEGGALVLADRGVCLIDEFDKMNEQDRTSIHEAMEQQSISVSKAGIVTSLHARCSVIAAANPIGGRYDSACTLQENVELTDPILQRFDVLCVLQDTVDPVADERMANFVTTSHMRSVPTSQIARGESLPIDASETQNSASTLPKIISQTLLRKYIQYARTNVKPVLRGNAFDQEKIASLYVSLRKESASSGGVPIAVRHIESIMRMAEAHAKMHLREYVRDDDMDASIGMMLTSFISAQKFSVRRQLQRSFAKYVSSGEDRAHLLLHILQDMMRNETMYQTIRQRNRGQSEAAIGMIEVPLEEFESRARDRRIYDVSEFCRGEAFREGGYVFDERKRIIARNHFA